MNTVIIDGYMYNIVEFFKNHGHPGGNVLLNFCGTDASVAYHSIHVTHGHVHFSLSQYKIGKAKQVTQATQVTQVKHTSITDICNNDYIFDSDFAKDLIMEVRYHIASNYKQVKHARNLYIMRSVAYLAFYLISTLKWVTNPNTINALSMGTASALMALNIAHDGSHGSLGKWSNTAANLFYLVGASRNLWFQQHIMKHHPFTNKYGCDCDLSSAEPYLYFDKSVVPQPVPLHTRWQHYLLPIILPAYSFIAIAESGKLAKYPDVIVNNHIKSQLGIVIACSVTTKLVYIVAPYFYSKYTLLDYIRHVCIYIVTSSVILTTLFIVSHNFKKAPLDPHTLQKEKCWYRSQVTESCTYGGHIAGMLTGGLNYQIEHHVFSRYPSYIYPIISPIIQKVCSRHSVPYTYFKTFWHNLVNTVSFLQVH